MHSYNFLNFKISKFNSLRFKLLLYHEKVNIYAYSSCFFTLNLNLLNASSVSKLHLTNSYNA